tara:strand:+ start:357 stop:614 length:258 start_codon:yes stop_codon:yes gene_type:complete
VPYTEPKYLINITIEKRKTYCVKSENLLLYTKLINSLSNKLITIAINKPNAKIYLLKKVEREINDFLSDDSEDNFGCYAVCCRST